MTDEHPTLETAQGTPPNPATPTPASSAPASSPKATTTEAAPAPAVDGESHAAYDTRYERFVGGVHPTAAKAAGIPAGSTDVRKV